MKIAIVGMSAMLPGASSVSQFWDNLMSGRDCRIEMTHAMIGQDPKVFYAAERGKSDKFYCLKGGYIDPAQVDLAGVKPLGQSMRDVDFAALDDVVKWPLRTVYDALSAVQSKKPATNYSRCGLLMGNLSFPTKTSNQWYLPLYHDYIQQIVSRCCAAASFNYLPVATTHQAQLHHTQVSSSPSAMVAAYLGLGGPCFSLDAACASTSYAVGLACYYLAQGRADMMVAGGVSAADPVFVNMGFSIFRAFPESGLCRPLDQSSNGLFAGEGAGALVLKRLADAEADGDHIYGVISGVGFSNDGKGQSVLSPKSSGQQLAFARAFASQDFTPADIDFIECHATGTPLGDKVELESIESFYQQGLDTLLIGSVKSSVGHLLTAAGIPSLVKMVLAMEQGRIPGTINLENPVVSPKGAIVRANIPATTVDWPARSAQTPRRCAINAFGFGGCNSHLLLEQYVPGTTTFGQTIDTTPQRLAITGMDMHFGGCKGLQAFYQTLYQGQQHFRPLPEKRWSGMLHSGITAPKAAYIESLDFDCLTMKVHPRPEELLIPQQLLMMSVAHQAIVDAGLTEGANVAVLTAMDLEPEIHRLRARVNLAEDLRCSLAAAGILLQPPHMQELQDIIQNGLCEPVGVNRFCSFIGNLMSSRISSVWDFNGPALTVSAEENSVFRALELAQVLLAASDVEHVVIAAVDLAGSYENLSVRRHLAEINAQADVLSLEADGQGTLIGEGAGAVVVSRAKDAARNGRTVYAEIDALAFSPGVSSDSVMAARELALAQAGARPLDIDYLELNASGVEQEDAAELAGLFAAVTADERQSVAVGSVKANIGHTFRASGMAALIKGALCLKHRFIAKMPAWTQPKQTDLWQQSRFYVPDQTKPWLKDSGSRRRLAISSLGQDGFAAHLILTETLLPLTLPVVMPQLLPLVIPVTGSDKSSLIVALNQLGESLQDGVTLNDVSRHWQQLFAAAPKQHCCVCLIAEDVPKLQRELRLVLSNLSGELQQSRQWTTPAGSYFTQEPLGPTAPVVTVYPGGFCSYPGMGRQLLLAFSPLLDEAAVSVGAFRDLFCEPLVYPRQVQLNAGHGIEPAAALFAHPVSMFESGIAYAVALTCIAKKGLQLKPAFSIGYSMGEVTMMYAHGVWAEMDTMSAKLRHMPVFNSALAGEMTTLRQAWSLPDDVDAPALWKAFVVKADVQKVREYAAAIEKVYVILINTPAEAVIAGHPDACQQLIDQLDCQFLSAYLADVIHCDIAGREFSALQALHTEAVQDVRHLQFFTAVGNKKLPLESHSIAANIATMYQQTVDFNALVNEVYLQGGRVFVELGPRDQCSRAITDILADRPHLVVPFDMKGIDSTAAFARAVAKLMAHRVDINTTLLAGHEGSALDKVQRLKIKVELGQSKSQQQINQLTTKILRQREAASSAALAEAFQSLVQPQSMTHHIALAANDIRIQEYKVSPEVKNRETLRGAQAGKAAPTVSEVIWQHQDLITFAEGKIADVFGADYAVIDSYSRRVRLPTSDYLFVQRVTALNATPGQYQPCSIVTEYDIPTDAVYLVDNRIPLSVAIESGQSDLLLISYLGIDFENKGQRVYRLLDCTLTFVDEMPQAGETLTYDIRINSFAKNGDSLLFFFSYECFCAGKLVLKMDNGCAGFFTDQELEAGKGIIKPRLQLLHNQQQSLLPVGYQPLQLSRSHFQLADLELLLAGEVGQCFGPAHQQAFAKGGPSISSRNFLMLDRISSIELLGGAYGLGAITGHKTLAPDHWYFPCHFVGDQVLAGSLMADGCQQLLKFFMLAAGLGQGLSKPRFQPSLHLGQKISCRGQVVAQDAELTYRMTITKLQLTPQIEVIANVDVLLDDKMIVAVQNVGLMMVSAEPYAPLMRVEPDYNRPAIKGVRPIQHFAAPACSSAPRRVDTLPYHAWHLFEFATGDLAKCFGEELAFRGKVAPRTPCGDLQLTSRVLHIDGERHNFNRIHSSISEYDVPVDAWYFCDNSQPDLMPYSILMEIALQPNGFLSTWAGTSLLFDQGLYFRNLDGEGQLLRTLDLRGKTIVNQTRLLSTVQAGNTVIQRFDFVLSVAGQPFYQGSSSFGYFTADMLQNQKGLDGGNIAALPDLQQQGQPLVDLPQWQKNQQHAAFSLAARQLRLLDRVQVLPAQGQFGLGLVYGEKDILAENWFFPFHFHEDPVMPGSLGVESMLEAMAVFVLQNNVARQYSKPRFSQLPGTTSWKYRGQITPVDRLMTVEVHISEILNHSAGLIVKANANLYKNGLRIYQVTDLQLAVTESI